MSSTSSQCSMTSLNMRTFRTSNPRKEKALNNKDRSIREGIKKEVVVVKVNIESEVNIEGEVKTVVRAEVKANDTVEAEDVLETSRCPFKLLMFCNDDTVHAHHPTDPGDHRMDGHIVRSVDFVGSNCMMWILNPSVVFGIGHIFSFRSNIILLKAI